MDIKILPSQFPVPKKQCQHLVNSYELYKNREWREDRYKKRSPIPSYGQRISEVVGEEWDPLCCQRQAAYKIGNKYYCTLHAGNLALKYWLEVSGRQHDQKPADGAESWNSNTWDGLKLPQRMRCARAVYHINTRGVLSRQDIMGIGEVSVNQASIDLREIQKRLPNLMGYDKSRKCYVLKEKRS